MNKGLDDRMQRPTMSVHTRHIRDIEDLRQPVKGTDVELSQLEGGQLTGSVTYGMLDTFSVSLGQFSKSLRARGIMSPDRQVIGMLIDRNKPVSHWSFDVQPGDILFDHLGGDHEGSYKGGAVFATIALRPEDFSDFMAGEDEISDFAFWQRRTLIRPEPILRDSITSRFRTIVESLEQNAPLLSVDGSDFWMRALVEAFIGGATGGVPWDGLRGPIKSSIIVRKVDDYLQEQGAVPVHISELCQALKVSRRSLHRAFDEVLGIGPVTYLRRHRLNSVRRVLWEGPAQTTSITEVAMNFGFDNMSRFGGYYKHLFGELPSQTVRRASGASK